jgi:type II secretory pathway component HofQ
MINREFGAFRNGVQPDSFQPPMPLLIHRFFTKVPLEKALQQVADRYNQNIVFTPEAQAKGETLVTARLVNVPIQTAVETLANMADLRVVRKANVFLVTTKKQAAELNAKNRKRQELKKTDTSEKPLQMK